MTVNPKSVAAGVLVEALDMLRQYDVRGAAGNRELAYRIIHLHDLVKKGLI